MNIIAMSDEIIGLPVETYIPELHIIIERVDNLPGNENKRTVKKHLCKMNGIAYFEIDVKDRVELANRIKQVFQYTNIFVFSDSEEDIVSCKEAFFKWKRRNN